MHASRPLSLRYLRRLASGIQGLSGGFAVYLAMVFAYAADVTSASDSASSATVSSISSATTSSTSSATASSATANTKNSAMNLGGSGRSSSFGLVESMLYLGNIIGPLVASRFAIHESKDLLIKGLFFECGVSVLLLVYILFVMPESLYYKTKFNDNNGNSNIDTPLLLDNELNDTAAMPNTTVETGTATTRTPPTTNNDTISVPDLRRNNIFSAVAFLFYRGSIARCILASIFMVNFIILISFLRVSFVYTGLKYHWKAEDFDRYSSLGRGLPMAIGAWMLAGCFGHHSTWKVQMRLIVIGSAGVIIRLIGAALAVTSEAYFLSGMLNVFSGLYTPLLRSTLSESASEENQGLLLTGIAAIETVSGIWAPLAFGTLYAYTEATNPEFVLYTMAGLGCISLILSGYLMVRPKKQVCVSIL